MFVTLICSVLLFTVSISSIYLVESVYHFFIKQDNFLKSKANDSNCSNLVEVMRYGFSGRICIKANGKNEFRVVENRSPECFGFFGYHISCYPASVDISTGSPFLPCLKWRVVEVVLFSIVYRVVLASVSGLREVTSRIRLGRTI